MRKFRDLRRNVKDVLYRDFDQRTLGTIMSGYEFAVINLMNSKTTRNIFRIVNKRMDDIEVQRHKKCVTLLIKRGFTSGIKEFKVDNKGIVVTIDPYFLRKEFSEFMHFPDVKKYIEALEEEYKLGKFWKMRNNSKISSEIEMSEENSKKTEEDYTDCSAKEEGTEPDAVIPFPAR